MNIRGSSACVVCWGRQSHVLLSQYIETVQRAHNECLVSSFKELALDRFTKVFPTTIELVINSAFEMDGRQIQQNDPVYNMPLLAKVSRDAILAAAQSCDVRFGTGITAVAREHWHHFNVSDAGMNYEQALKINDKQNIAQIHNDTIMRENCWMHTDEIATASTLPQSSDRCLACSQPFDSTRINLINNVSLSVFSILHHIKRRRENTALAELQKLKHSHQPIPLQQLWEILSKCVEYDAINVAQYTLKTFKINPKTLATNWQCYGMINGHQLVQTCFLYRCIQDPKKSAATLKRVFSEHRYCTRYQFGKTNLIGRMIVAHRSVPAILVNKLQLLLQNIAEFASTWGVLEFRQIFFEYASNTNKFPQDDFVRGFDLLYQCVCEMNGHSKSVPWQAVVPNQLVIYAVQSDDMRLLSFLVDRGSNIHIKNAFFFASSPPMIRFLFEQGVNVHDIDTDGSTPLTALLQRVLDANDMTTSKNLQEHVVCECVALYFSYGLHQELMHKKTWLQTSLILRTCHQFECYYSKPLELVEKIVEKYPGPRYHNLWALVKTFQLYSILPTWATHLYLTKLDK